MKFRQNLSSLRKNRDEDCKHLVIFLENYETITNVCDEQLLNFEVGEVSPGCCFEEALFVVSRLDSKGSFLPKDV